MSKYCKIYYLYGCCHACLGCRRNFGHQSCINRTYQGGSYYGLENTPVTFMLRENLHNFLSFRKITGIADVYIPDGVDIKDLHDYPEFGKVDPEAQNLFASYATISNYQIFDNIGIWEDEDCCVKIVEKNAHLLCYVKNQTHRICLAAVNTDGNTIVHVKDPYRISEMFFAALKHGAHWRIIPEWNVDTLTESEYIDLVSYDPVMFMPMVPYRRRTHAICLAAVKRNGSVLSCVPDKTADICAEAVKNSGHAIEHVPEEFKTKELIHTALHENGYAIRYIRNITEEMKIIAIKSRPQCIYLMGNLTYEQCELAVNCDPAVFRCVPEMYRTTILTYNAVKKYGLNISHVKKQTRKLCLLAVRNNADALQFINIQTEQLCLIAVRENGLTIRHVKKLTPKICFVAVKQNTDAYYYIIKRTKELMCLAATMSPSWIQSVDPAYYMHIIKKNGMVLEYIADQTEEMCMAAVNQNAFAVQFVIKKTKAIRELAIRRNPRAAILCF